MDEQNISVCVTDLSVRIGEQFAQFANMDDSGPVAQLCRKIIWEADFHNTH